LRRLYVDSSAFLALFRRSDGRHADVLAHFQGLRRRRCALVTSEAVMVETATRLRYDLGLGATLEFRDNVVAGVADGTFTLRESTAGLRAAAFGVMEENPRLRPSYADCMGVAVARDEEVDAVFGLDTDFRELGFRLEPG
jgi:predicted nucleic acid-binding protein